MAGRPIDPSSRGRKYYVGLLSELGRLETAVQIDSTVPPDLVTDTVIAVGGLRTVLLEHLKRLPSP